jgi:glycine dehydrogenase subunit 1
MVYEANTPDDLRVMLRAIGMSSLDDLFKTIPEGMRTKGALQIPPALSELELTTSVSQTLALNQGADQKVCFLGGGAYDHFIPAVVDNLSGRGEFYTAYTPYQAEASQGTLQATFEYQTLMTQLTGLDVSNSSLYDGGSAAAEAMLMALAVTKRFGKVVVAETVHPETRHVLATFLEHL